MRSLTFRNGHEALPAVLYLLDKEGVPRNSRNGPVLQIPGGLVLTYTHPCERVIFWPERDANPFFHLYEALWMLEGRNDVAPLVRYTKQMQEYSDNGVTLHGAYGHRWRTWFSIDQILRIINLLQSNPEDRRCVLQMWDPESDLGWKGKDVPCNLTATFQINQDAELDMVVFNRSNDIIWGMLGANLVHFGVLQEYMATQIGVPVGTYTQISANAHAYLKTYEPLRDLPRPYSQRAPIDPSPYNPLIHPGLPWAVPVPMAGITRGDIQTLLTAADADFKPYPVTTHPFIQLAATVLLAHCMYRHFDKPDNFLRSMDILYPLENMDWAVAAREWIQRRYDKWQQQ